MKFLGMFLLKDSESHNSMPGIKTLRKTGIILHNVSKKKKNHVQRKLLRKVSGCI